MHLGNDNVETVAFREFYIRYRINFEIKTMFCYFSGCDSLEFG